MDFQWVSVLRSIGSFIGIFFGSFVLGCAMGLLTALLLKFSKLRDYPLLETAMFVIMSYSTFLFAEFAQLTGMFLPLSNWTAPTLVEKLFLRNSVKYATFSLF